MCLRWWNDEERICLHLRLNIYKVPGVASASDQRAGQCNYVVDVILVSFSLRRAHLMNWGRDLSASAVFVASAFYCFLMALFFCAWRFLLPGGCHCFRL